MEKFRLESEALEKQRAAKNPETAGDAAGTADTPDAAGTETAGNPDAGDMETAGNPDTDSGAETE